MTVIFLSEVLKLVYMSDTPTRDAERTTGTPPPLIVCAWLKALLHGAINCSCNCNKLQQLFSALLHTGNQYSVGCCRGRVLYWLCDTWEWDLDSVSGLTIYTFKRFLILNYFSGSILNTNNYLNTSWLSLKTWCAIIQYFDIVSEYTILEDFIKMLCI